MAAPGETGGPARWLPDRSSDGLRPPVTAPSTVPIGPRATEGSSTGRPSSPAPGAEGRPGAAPGSTFVYGPCRPLVNLLLYAAAETAGPPFHWLDIREPSAEIEKLDPAELGWIDAGHLWAVDPVEAFAPDNARANAALFELIRSDEPPETLARLSEFLRLPARLQQILARDPRSAGPGVIAVANADRTRRAFSEGLLPPILEAVAGAGFALYVGYGGSGPAAREAFQSVLRVDGPRLERWADATVTLERGRGLAGLRPREPARIADLPSLRSVLQRALDRA